MIYFVYYIMVNNYVPLYFIITPDYEPSMSPKKNVQLLKDSVPNVLEANPAEESLAWVSLEQVLLDSA